MASTREPTDEEVRNTIFSVLQSLNGTPVKPNKLRKLVCRQKDGTTWTQFARCLDAIIENSQTSRKKLLLVSENESGERVISIPSDEARVVVDDDGNNESETIETSNNDDRNNDDVGMKKKKKPKKGTSTSATTTVKNVKIPLAIALHLSRKSHRKLKNVEKNTKTKIIILQKDGKVWKHHSVNHNSLKKINLNETLNAQIEALSTTTKDDDDDDDDEETTMKHVKTASSMLKKMVSAYQKNPDHFTPKKSGGTFEEQAMAKKRKEEDKMRRLKKKGGQKNDQTEHDEKETSGDSIVIAESRGTPGKKKRKRDKFY